MRWRRRRRVNQFIIASIELDGNQLRLELVGTGPYDAKALYDLTGRFVTLEAS